jgi:peptidoglycan/xylan/chitin deacetylase (PgdA/CDA1 family)
LIVLLGPVQPGADTVRRFILACLLAATLVGCAASADERQSASSTRDGRAVAVTFDDLPARGDLATMRETTTKLLRTLTAERIPATGFVNESKLAVVGEGLGAALLAAWLDTGFDLGNHTYSHVSIDDVPFDTYKADLIKGEAVTRRLLQARGRRLRYFRHPQLRTGPTAEYKASLDALLSERGYRVAPVTVDNNDFVFADVYGRARARGDRDTMTRVAAAYVPYMESVFAHFEGLSRQFLGYELPQVLLLHANELNADFLPALVNMLRARGYAFVTLDEALDDPAYRLPEQPAARGLSWLHRWMLAKGLNMQPEPPEPPFVRDLFNVPRQ